VDTLFENIVKEHGISYAVFDEHLVLVDCSDSFYIQFDHLSPKEEPLIWDIFPEVIGVETEVREIQAGRSESFRLERISHLDRRMDVHYYNLSIVRRDPQSEDVLCLLTDVTGQAQLEQILQQQTNELKLLQASLHHNLRHGSFRLIGHSEQIENVRSIIRKIRNIHGTTVLLQGESGTGKNLVARLIHQSSDYADCPFVELNCAAIPSTLLEAELFGYEKGAFTNAVNSKKGLLETADGGTLFLDEISELPLTLQSKFLSFIETKRFRRLGSTIERTVKVRIIAATNRDLREAVDAREFRQDLFFRINILSLNMPPLRDLDDDVLEIAQNFVVHYASEFGKRLQGLSPSAKQKLLAYEWPGNIRELRNAIERASIFAEGPLITAEDLFVKAPGAPGGETESSHFDFNLPDEGFSIYEFEKELIQKALKKAQSNQTRAAKLLGLSLDTLRYRMKKYDIIE
jgi:transcriptional regulator with PAS, ATPase and Fis domain